MYPKQKINHKQGDTFTKPCQRLNKLTSLPIDLTGYNIKSQVRTRPDAGDALVAELTVTIVNAVAGSFTLSNNSTQAWPVENLVWDIQYTLFGVVISTDSMFIQVYADGTR